jgi:5-methylcytosine-specific restriction endonuclease McrA
MTRHCYPRLSQTDSNKSGVFFCKRDHQHAFNTTNAVSPYYGYRVYILVRDQAKCFLCHGSGKLHVHHILRRGLGGTDDYQNLIVLCQGCHLGKAHGIEAQKYKAIFFEYTAQFAVPEFWPQVMERSAHDRRKIAALKRKTSKSRYQKIKESDRFKKYQEKQRAWRKKRNQEHREKYGCSYMTYRRRLILAGRAKQAA